MNKRYVIKATETRCDLHGNTLIKTGDWVAIGDSPDDPYKNWVQFIKRIGDEAFRGYESPGTDRYFVPDIVDYSPREEDPR